MNRSHLIAGFAFAASLGTFSCSAPNPLDPSTSGNSDKKHPNSSDAIGQSGLHMVSPVFKFRPGEHCQSSDAASTVIVDQFNDKLTRVSICLGEYGLPDAAYKALDVFTVPRGKADYKLSMIMATGKDKNGVSDFGFIAVVDTKDTVEFHCDRTTLGDGIPWSSLCGDALEKSNANQMKTLEVEIGSYSDLRLASSNDFTKVVLEKTSDVLTLNQVDLPTE